MWCGRPSRATIVLKFAKIPPSRGRELYLFMCGDPVRPAPTRHGMATASDTASSASWPQGGGRGPLARPSADGVQPMDHRQATGWDFLPAPPPMAGGGPVAWPLTPRADCPPAVAAPQALNGEFARSQQAGLNAIISLASPPTSANGTATRAPASHPLTTRAPAGQPPTSGAPAGQPPTTGAPAGQPPTTGAPAGQPPTTRAGANRTPATGGSTGRSRPEHRFWHLPGLSLMVVILTTQAVLSLRLLHASTAFGDEALYLWAGHLELAHWLHGASLPAFPTWFSGSPVIYPPIGALADRAGGLAGARILSLGFMLTATCLLWGTTSRLFGRRSAFFAAALFAVIGPTLHLGTFATYDAMALCLVALAAWCACGARTKQDATGWILAAAGALAMANATKYASAIFDPIVVIMAVLSAHPAPGGKAALRRGSLLLTSLTGALAVLLRFGGSWYMTGISQTTTMRPNGGVPIARVLADSWQWTAVVVVAALAGVLLCALKGNSRPTICLVAALAATALLVPAEQARIATTVSLNKHVDFGAWFACIAAGYALSCLATWLHHRYAQLAATAGLSAAVVMVAGA